jgi:hypothetical protein
MLETRPPTRNGEEQMVHKRRSFKCLAVILILIGAMVEFSPDAALAQNGEGILGPHGNVITGKKEFIQYSHSVTA